MSLPPRRFPEALAGRYRVIRRIGAGAMGAVFLVEDREVGDRPVAVKVTALEGALAAELRARFLREARALAGLEHPAVLRVYDVGEVDGLAFLVTEYLEGTSLERPLPGLDVVGALLQVAEGLDAVHAARLVHRDLKPANVFWTKDARAVLLDFGLVLDPGASALTSTGRAVGTPATMAPEVLQGRPAVPASDWYSWGATLYMVMERRPLRGESDLYALLGGQDVPLPEFRAVAADPRARDLVAAALTLDPEERMEAVQLARARVGEGGAPRELPSSWREEAPAPQAEGPARPGSRLRWWLAAALFAGGVWLGWPGSAEPVAAGNKLAESAQGPGDQEARLGSLAADLAAVEQGFEAAVAKVPRARDPAQWGRVVAQVPALSRLWARDVAGMPDLEPGNRARLRLLDVRFAGAGLPRPFLVEDSPVPSPPGGRGGRLWDAVRLPAGAGGPPPELEGVIEALHRVHALSDMLEEDLDLLVAEGQDPKGLVPELVPLPALATSGPRTLLRMALASPETREVAARWVRPGADEVRRSLRLAARVLPLLSGREREVVTHLHRWALGGDSAWFTGELASWPPESLLPNLPDDGPGAGLRAIVYNLQRPVLRRMGLDWRTTGQAGVSWGQAALETDPAPGGEVPGWEWRRRVLTDVLLGLVELERGGEARALLRRERGRLRLEVDQASLMDIAEILSVVWQAAGGEATSEVEWLLAHLDPQKGRYRERLKRYLGWATGGN